MIIEGLHHIAYRCRDSEQTRTFYEEFLGLPLANAFEIRETKTGRETRVLHSFYEMVDGSYLAFFEAPGQPFEFKAQHDYDLHTALRVPFADLAEWLTKAKAAGVECRGIADHRIVESIYLRDPNGYVIELAGKRPEHDQLMDAANNGARRNLLHWQETKTALNRTASEEHF
jgi:catechol 2,3-dioxygenase-like lactoylglutathione lyase family enzyme